MSEKIENIKKDTRSRSWFCVLNNPKENVLECRDKTPEEICKILSDMWCISDSRSGAWVYCVSAEGLEHVHMVLEDKNKTCFSIIKRIYQTAHIAMTQGNKKQVEEYIYKIGKFEEKGEKIIKMLTVGEIVGRQGKRSDLEEIKRMIYDEKLTPKQILSKSADFYKSEKYINKMYYDKKMNETPVRRDVEVTWCFGGTGTGKTFFMSELTKKYGREEVYICNAMNKNPFDGYEGQSIICIDELRADSGYFDFSTLLSVLDCYTIEIKARYQNKLMLWTKVYITSPLLPHEIYTSDYYKKHDKINQLIRRIGFFNYFYINSLKEHKIYSYDNRNNCLPVSREVIIASAEQAEKMELEEKKESSGLSANVPEDDDLSDFVEIYNPYNES